MANNKGKPFAIVTKDKNIVTKSVYDRYAIKKNNESNQIFQDTFRNYYNDDIKEPLYNMESLANLTEINSYHLRCVKTKAQDIAGIGYEFLPTGDQDNEKTPSEEQINRAKEFFSSQWPPIEIILKKCETDYHSIGNMYIELVREGDLPQAPYKILSHIPGHTMRVCTDRNRYVQKRGAEKVYFKKAGFDKDVDIETGEIKSLGSLNPERRASEVIHDFNYSSRSDFYGLPDVISCLGAIKGHLSQRDYNIKFFENFGIPAYAVYITGDYDLGENLDEEAEDSQNNGEPAIVRTIRKYLDKVQDEPHSTLVFGVPSRDGGTVQVKFEPLAVDIKDASFRLYRQDNRDEVIVAHGVPAYRIGVIETGSLSGNLGEVSNEIYFGSVVFPRQRRIESYINKFIMRENLEITDWKFRLKSVDITSEENDRETLESLFERGGASPNDLIRNLGSRFGINPVEDDPALNAHYIGGQPITNLDQLDYANVQMAMQSLQNKLIEIAKKNEAVKYADKNRQ